MHCAQLRCSFPSQFVSQTLRCNVEYFCYVQRPSSSKEMTIVRDYALIKGHHFVTLVIIIMVTCQFIKHISTCSDKWHNHHKNKINSLVIKPFAFLCWPKWSASWQPLVRSDWHSLAHVKQIWIEASRTCEAQHVIKAASYQEASDVPG